MSNIPRTLSWDILGLFSYMTDALKEFVERIVQETREEDLAAIRMANNSYTSILGYVKSLDKNLSSFNRVFKKDDEGFFLGFSMGAKIRREEHNKMYIEFLETTRSNAPQGYKASAQLVGNTYVIHLYFTAPPEVITNSKSYNVWLASNLERVLSTKAMRSYYVHEFIHTLDFKRVPKDYLFNRSSAETVANTPEYINAPLELNAYFSQTISNIRNKLRKAATPEEKWQILGRSPHEFVQKFMDLYLAKHVKTMLSPENQQRFMKRAASTWDLLKKDQQLREAIDVFVDEAMFHGTANDFQEFKLNQNGILWLAYEPETSKAYADFQARNKNTKESYLWSIELNPKAKIIDMEDLSNPIIREIKDNISKIKEMTIGHGITDDDWNKYANYNTLENHSWIRRLLKSKKVDGLIVNDTITTTTKKHKSIALFNLKTIISSKRNGNEF